MVNRVFLTGFIASLLFVSLVAYSMPAFANLNDLPDQSRADVIAVMGIGHIQGEPVIVEILVEIQPGENANQVTRGVLKANNLKPFGSADLGSDGFTVTGFFWPGDSPGLTQFYNPDKEEVLPDAEILQKTHSDWNGVNTSKFVFTYDDISDNCPSMAKECRGPQVFDQENTVGWLVIKERGVLAKAYFATHSTWGPETDIVLNTKYAWNGNCADPDGNIDVETVLRHENGHAAGIGHSKISTALMAPYYSGPNCELTHYDDKEAITYLYDDDILGSVSGIVTDGDGTAIVGVTVKLVGTTLGNTTVADGSYTISGIPDPVTYDVTASHVDFESFTIKRLLVDESDSDETGVDFTLTSSGGGSDGSDPEPTTCTQPNSTTLDFVIDMDLELKGPWANLLIPVHVSDDDGTPEPNVCVDIDLSRAERSWDLSGTTDNSGNVSFKLSHAWLDEPYTAELVNKDHFNNLAPASGLICKQINGTTLNLDEC